MAKRFTDTEKWGDPWFHGLAPKLKMAWSFLCDSCDGVGVWKVNLPLLSFYIGEEIDEADFREAFDKRLVWLTEEKVWIPGFIRFQYQTLSPKNSAHRGIIKKIVTMTQGLPLDDSTREMIERFKKAFDAPLDPRPTPDRPPTEGQPTLKEKEEEKYKEKEKEEEKKKGGVGENNRAPAAPPTPAPDAIALCLEAWAGTLKHFGIDRPVSHTEEMEIGRALLAHKDAAFVELALFGYRFQEKTQDYDPGKYVRIGNVFKRDDGGKPMIDKYANLGAQKRRKAKQTLQQPQVSETPHTTCPPELRGAIKRLVGIGD